ncbi:MAG: DJ-1/PfpI family protein [Spirochaetia bacterium]
MKLENKKIGIFIESDFYENEIFYYNLRFPEEGAQVDFFSRLWGQDCLVFEGHEYKAKYYCNKSFEDCDPSDYDAIIVPAGMVSDRLRYSEDPNKLPPACEFLKKAFQDKNILKGIICHGIWMVSPIAEVIKGRKVTVHNNCVSDAKNMGAVYVDQDVAVDEDLVTARTGGHCNFFAKKIIQELSE